MGWKAYFKPAWTFLGGAFVVETSPIGIWKDFLHTYFWDVVLNATRDELKPVVAMVIDWLPLLLFIAVWIAFLEGKFKRAIIKKAKSLNYPLTIAVFLVVAFLLDMRYMYWISYIRDPIEWDLATPVQFHADGTPGIVYADKFYISGTARKKVVLSAASVVSSKSNLSLILLAGVDSRTGEVSGLNEIPEGAKFSLYNDIPAQGQKMTSNQFLVEWPQFTFVFESNGKRYEYPVDKDLVDKMIHEKELAYRPPILPTVSWKRP